LLIDELEDGGLFTTQWLGLLWFNGYFDLVRYSELSSAVEDGLDL